MAATGAAGFGQVCTSPGVLIVRDDAASQTFVQQLGEALATATTHAMLHPGIRAGVDAGVARVHSRAGVRTLLAPPHSEQAPKGRLFATDAATFIADHELREEVFGPACRMVTVRSLDEPLAVLQAIEGSLTAAQQHGGTWPSSTQPFSTSVGHAALDRFLRPLALQDAPQWLVDAQGLA